MTTKPTYVLVTGVAHTPIHMQTLAEALRRESYPTEVVSHPTVGSSAATAPPNADARNLGKILRDLVVNQHRQVVLLCHAYGGLVGCQCVNGLERSARAKQGRDGGILKVFFLSGLLPQEGESMLQVFGEAGIVPREWMDMHVSVLFRWSFSANSLAADTLYHDLPAEEASHWATKLLPMSAHVGITPATDVCWNADIQKAYIFCTEDRVFSIEEQRRMLERVQSDAKHDSIDWETYEMDCGHCPFLSHPKELLDILKQ
ncbi:AB hydrolase-1 domain-containing protein [Favolaschia claudopus]|uniref:AB hydrolase-1 domain-containing protein n=1 Tax=Favolaschia claudopus TaxID=2862362 RepID=A0AAW0DAB8_9AGAR